MLRTRSLVLLGLSLGGVLLARADTVYSYSGFDFTTEEGTALYLADPRWTLSENISITADFAAPISPGLTDQTVVPLFWSVDVGTTDFTSTDGSSLLEDSSFTTDSSGKITNWFFYIIGDGSLFPISTSGETGDVAGVFGPDFGGSASTARIGEWTTTPEPGSLGIFIAGLAAILCLRDRLAPSAGSAGVKRAT